ncbi:MAG: hypothetical protein N3D84_00475 [Candidatus Woesearchaeota archaeon]|nr:hypothetical protein [Candidatus Woesearchaeota archaeon]
MDDVLKEIKEAESKAKRIIEEANKRKEEALVRARRDSLVIFNEEKERIDAANNSRIKKAAEEIEQKKRAILEKGSVEIKKMEENAKKNVKKAEDFIMKKFEEKIAK